jgi:hypothetical protein
MKRLLLALVVVLSAAAGAQTIVGGYDQGGKQHAIFVNDAGQQAVIIGGTAPGVFPSYQNPTPYYNNTGAYGTVAADFNGDGNPDLAVAQFNAGTIAIYLGTATGVFPSAPSSTLTAGNSPRFCAVADFNNDGALDLACTNKTDGTVSVFLGVGNGTFSAQSVVTTLANNQAIAAGVLGSGSTNPSFITCNRSSTACAVYVGNGSGGFASGVALTGLTSAYQIQLADMNGDGILDFVDSSQATDLVGVAIGTASATVFGTLITQTTGTTNGIAVGDVNADGLMDIVSSSGSTFATTLGNAYTNLVAPPTPGGGPFAQWAANPTQQYLVSANYNGATQGVSLADVNGDGFLDAIISTYDVGQQNDGLVIMTNNGYGVFNEQAILRVPLVKNVVSSYSGLYPIATLYDGRTPLDLNHDGRPDFIVGNFNGAAASGNAAAIPTFYAWLSTPITQIAPAPGAVFQVNPQVPPGPPIYTSAHCVSGHATRLGQPINTSYPNFRRASILVETQFDPTPMWLGGPNVVTCEGCPFSISDAGFVDGGPGVLGEMLVPGGSPPTSSATKQMGNLGSAVQPDGWWCIKATGAQDGTADAGVTIAVELRQ